MKVCQAPLFRKRQFAAEIIVTCVRWYLRFSLSLRDVEELMAERGLSVDHTSVGHRPMRQKCSVACMDNLSRKVRPGTSTRPSCGSLAVGCTCSAPSTATDFYLSETRDREAAKCFLKRALANPDNRPPHVFARDKLRSYSAAIRELRSEGQLHPTCRQRTRRYSNNRIESDHRPVKRRLRAMQGPRTMATACAVIAGIEAVQMIRKGQVLGITRFNLRGQAWMFGTLLGLD